MVNLLPYYFPYEFRRGGVFANTDEIPEASDHIAELADRRMGFVSSVERIVSIDGIEVLLSYADDPITRKAVLMTYVDGYSQDEVAERTGLTRKAVEPRLARWRKKAKGAP